VKSVLEKVATDHPNKFKIRYGDALQLRRNLTEMNFGNISTPIICFVQRENFGYKKWLFTGKITPMSVSAFVADQQWGKNPETIMGVPVGARPSGQLKWLTGPELHKGLDKNKDKDYVVNFVGFPCVHCAEVDALFAETAEWAYENGVKSVVFARVNASCNDVPTTVWRNETYPYGWFFPARNRSEAFPIGKRRQLYWMVHLLKDNMSQSFHAHLPPKPEKTPYVKREDL
jgi:hypothetical protein